MKQLWLSVWVLILCVIALDAAPPRQRKVIRAFIKAHGYPTDYVPGTRDRQSSHVVDHEYPLCAGGDDALHNLQWQTRAESYRKDADERRLCAQVRAFEQTWGVVAR